MFDLQKNISAGLVEVIIYSSPDDKKKNRGFCFLEYESHKAASLAKRRLGTGRIKVNNLMLSHFRTYGCENIELRRIVYSHFTLSNCKEIEVKR